MPYVDHARREIRLKVVYYGPGLGGKTTNLEWMHGAVDAKRRGKLVALNTEAERTLFFDLLPVDLGTYRGYRVRLHLCTVPGQIAHDETRKLVLRHVDGIVFVVDSQADRLAANVASIENLQVNLRAQGDNPATMPLVVQYNKRDLPSALGIATLSRELRVTLDVPQVVASAAAGIGVFETLKQITRACLDVVSDPSLAPAGRSPSIVPGQHSSMFPEAQPPGLQASLHPAAIGPAVGSAALKPEPDLSAPRLPDLSR